MTILYSGLGRFEDVAEMQELEKQRRARLLEGSIITSDANSCIGNESLMPGWVPIRSRRPGEPPEGRMATNE